MDSDRLKALYEDLDALHVALPETERERLAEVVGALTATLAAERKLAQANVVRRWRRDQGYGDFR